MVEWSVAPSRLAIDRAVEANRLSGHENRGFLSPTQGLMPDAEPTLRLPQSHRAWDEAAAELPVRYQEVSVRRALDRLPVLPSGDLPDRYLLRAAMLLGILAHAYWRSEPGTEPGALPDGIRVPWAGVSGRLGRPVPHLSYVDLIVYNWRLVDPRVANPRRVENMRLLVPTVDNRSEHVFYLTQAEILARCTPAVNAVIGAQEAVHGDDPDRLVEELAVITRCLDEVTWHALPKISPRESSATYVNPVEWAKTVAPFAVPPDATVLGPSGTASPIFHVLDAFFGRIEYRSRLGAEMAQLLQWHPPHWRQFVDAVARTSVRRYVRTRGGPALRAAFDEAFDRYAGESGFLGRHRLKVYGFLEVAFKVGRTTTIGRFAGPFKDRAWNEVDKELANAVAERDPGQVPAVHAGVGLAADPAPAPEDWPAPRPGPARNGWPAGNRGSRPDGVRRVGVGELAMHNADPPGLWIAVEGSVYDVTGFARAHPGGGIAVRAHAGTDATAVFQRIGHVSHQAVQAILRVRRIGSLPSGPAHPGLAGLYRIWRQALYLAAEMENALRIDYLIQPVGKPVTPLTARFLAEIHDRARTEYVDGFLGDWAHRLWRHTLAACGLAEDADWMRNRLRGVAGALTGAATDLDALQRADQAFLADVKRALSDGVRVLEPHDGGPTPVLANALTSTLRRLVDAAQMYVWRTG